MIALFALAKNNLGFFMQSSSKNSFESLKLGMTSDVSKVITELDIANFAQVSGDFNPVHMNEEYAKTTMFAGRIAHGMLSASFISTVLGTKLPGSGSIYLSQTLKFKAPVRIGDLVTARVEIIDIVQEKRIVTLKTVCTVKDQVVIDGEATLKILDR